MPKVFISYESSHDAAFARMLAERLRKAAIKVWLDKEMISAGEPVNEKLREAIDRIDSAVFLLSPTSIRRDYMTKELQLVALRDTTGEKIRRIGVLRAPRSEMEALIPAELARFSQIEWVDGETDPDAAFWRLYAAILRQEPGPEAEWAVLGQELAGMDFSSGDGDDFRRAVADAPLPDRMALLVDRGAQWTMIEALYPDAKHHLVLIAGTRGAGHEYFVNRIEAFLRSEPPHERIHVTWSIRPISAAEHRERLALALTTSRGDLIREMRRRMAHRNLIVIHPIVDADYDDPVLVEYYCEVLPSLLKEAKPAMNMKCLQPVAWQRAGMLATFGRRLLRRRGANVPHWLQSTEEREAFDLIRTMEGMPREDAHDLGAAVRVELGEISEADVLDFLVAKGFSDVQREDLLARVRERQSPAEKLKEIDIFIDEQRRST